MSVDSLKDELIRSNRSKKREMSDSEILSLIQNFLNDKRIPETLKKALKSNPKLKSFSSDLEVK